MPSADSSSKLSSIADEIARILEVGDTAVLATTIEAPSHLGAKLLINKSGNTFGGLGWDSLDEAVRLQSVLFLKSKQDLQVFRVNEFAPALTDLVDTQILFERIQPEPRVVICGAGHVGAALANLAHVLGYECTLIDDRAEFVTRESFPDSAIDLIAAQNWFDAVSDGIGNGHGIYVAVVTRGHSEDETCMRAIMNCSPEYVGLIGSKRRTDIVIERLRVAGADEEFLKKIHAPIGLDIGAVTPEEVALAIMAEIVAVRREGKGGSLSELRRSV